MHLKIPYFMPDSQFRRSKHVAEHFSGPTQTYNAARPVVPATVLQLKASKSSIIKQCSIDRNCTLANFSCLFVFLLFFQAIEELFVQDHVDV
jgi:hypothetical protein